MPSAFSPEGLTFADLIRNADACKAKADKCYSIIQNNPDLDGESKEWIEGLIAVHRRDESLYRTWAEALSHDPAPESS